ncbi:MAG: RsmD family RNA methyltransferase [Verrucomicrobiae bacterium]|nr:RsmD family RNA methyltransferase [Verrucomicrobiae bacterium]
MRIIAGFARGMPLVVPRGQVRPTADRVREAIFSSLGERVVGAVVLDLFAGSGALGLEAASRGAAAVTFVETCAGALGALRKNIAAIRRYPDMACVLRVLREDVFRLPAFGETFTLIFADPPYGDAAQRLLAVRLPLASDGLLVLESARRTPLEAGGIWTVEREAVYGDTRVSFLRRAEAG